MKMDTSIPPKMNTIFMLVYSPISWMICSGVFAATMFHVLLYKDVPPSVPPILSTIAGMIAEMATMIQRSNLSCLQETCQGDLPSGNHRRILQAITLFHLILIFEQLHGCSFCRASFLIVDFCGKLFVSLLTFNS